MNIGIYLLVLQKRRMFSAVDPVPTLQEESCTTENLSEIVNNLLLVR
jgi:hypothetical protein